MARINTAIRWGINAIGVVCSAIVRQFGYVLIPTHEIDRLEYEARCAYAYRAGTKLNERDDGYFNGLGDSYSRTAHDLRAKYMPNNAYTNSGSDNTNPNE